MPQKQIIKSLADQSMYLWPCRRFGKEAAAIIAEYDSLTARRMSPVTFLASLGSSASGFHRVREQSPAPLPCKVGILIMQTFCRAGRVVLQALLDHGCGWQMLHPLCADCICIAFTALRGVLSSLWAVIYCCKPLRRCELPVRTGAPW